MKKKPFFEFENAQGKNYKLLYKKPHRCHKANGVCQAPWLKSPKIWISPNLKQRKELSVVIEEMAHAFFYEKPESHVQPFAARLAKLLYKSGWRKTSRPKR